MPDEPIPSEALYGVSKQPSPTCPIIDTGIRTIVKLQKHIRGYERAEQDELRDLRLQRLQLRDNRATSVGL